MTRFRKLELTTSDSNDAIAVPGGVPSPSQEKDPTSWMKRADDNRRMGQYENALRYYSRALENDKSIVAAWTGQVYMLVQLEEYPEAETWSRKALELFPQDGDLMAARAQALCRMGTLQPAFAAIDGAMNQPGMAALRWMIRGELLLVGRQSTDRHCFDKALQLDNDWLIATEIGRIYLYYRQPSNALNRARIGVERNPDAAFAWYTVGQCQTELGLTAQARRSFQTCLELFPGHREAEQSLHSLDANGSFFKRLRSFWRR